MPIHKETDEFTGEIERKGPYLSLHWVSPAAHDPDGYWEPESMFRSDVRRFREAGLELPPEMKRAEEALTAYDGP